MHAVHWTSPRKDKTYYYSRYLLFKREEEEEVAAAAEDVLYEKRKINLFGALALEVVVLLHLRSGSSNSRKATAGTYSGTHLEWGEILQSQNN